MLCKHRWVIVVALLAVLTGRAVQITRDANHKAQSPAVRWLWAQLPAVDNRLEPARRFFEGVPAGSTVGYFRDPHDPKRYQLTQFALVPIVVIEGQDHQFLLVDFDSNDQLHRWLAEQELKSATIFGPGLALVEKGSP